jgi:GH15 family glucan-1,4-alpha-glucosidase
VAAPATDTETPIGDYGLIGDTRTAALVSSDGAIDWMCAPRFDSEPVFGRLVGGPAAGRFRIRPAQPATIVGRLYRHRTATLETTWVVGDTALTLADTMISEVAGRLLPAGLLVRTLTARGNSVDVEVELDPRLGEHHRRPRTRRQRGILTWDWGPLAMSLQCDINLNLEIGAPWPLTVPADRPVSFVLAVAHREPLVQVDPETARGLVAEDEARWRAWASDIGNGLAHCEVVIRSLLTLRLLTYSPSGAPVAAATTSLPERRGGIRNWDYRYAWPRDASIGVAAFLGVGKTTESRAFLAWLLHATRLTRPRIPALLTLDGRPPPAERPWSAWPGYADSSPVRIGNDAADQHQLDGYGWVLDAAWVLEQAGHHLHGETWRAMRAFADLVARRWQEPDAGIWEVRGDMAHHVHSKLMAWLALDRALRLAETHRLPARQRRRWTTARDAVADEITVEGFNPEENTFTRTYGSADLDAALLVLPLLGLEDPHSPRVTGTIDAIRAALSAGGPLLYRYPPGQDGLSGTEGAFLPCSFWLVQALALVGRGREAHALFDELVALATPLGLYAEEMDPATRTHLGNIPQALTHAALVQAALALRDVDDRSRPVFPR